MFHPERKIPYLIKNEITEIYVVHSLRTLATSTIAVFLPIFLLSKGYSFSQAFSFFLIQSVMVLLTIQFFVNFAAKKGFKHSIMLSIPLTIVFFSFLLAFDQLLITFTDVLGSSALAMNFLLVSIAFVGVISKALYWMGFHLDFAKVHNHDKSAKQVSWLHALSLLFSILGPIIGATLIVTQGFETLFVLIIFLFVLSVIPLLLTNDFHEPVRVNLKSVMSKDQIKKHYPYIGEGFREMAAAVFWPVLLFLIAISLESIGALYTLTNALLVLFTMLVGKFTTELNKHHFLKLGIIIHSATLVLRTLIKSISAIAMTQGMGAISYSLFRIPFESIHYNRGKNQGIVQIVYAREVFLHLGQTLSILCFLALFAFTKDPSFSLMITIILGALSSFLMTKISDD